MLGGSGAEVGDSDVERDLVLEDQVGVVGEVGLRAGVARVVGSFVQDCGSVLIICSWNARVTPN